MFLYKRCICATIMSVFLLAGNIVSGADITAIENLMKQAAGAKKAPSDREIAVMEAFINEAVDEILASTAISEAINARTQIVSFKGDTEDLSLYTRSYILSARKKLIQAFGTVAKWPAQAGKLQTERNLMILTARLASVELRDLGFAMIDHPDCTVRYWAVKSIAGDVIASQLNSPLTGDADVKAAIVKALEKRLENEKQPEIIGLIARFAGLLKGSEGAVLLNKAADIRIAAYNDWTVKYEMIDANILNSMTPAISSTPAGKELELIAGKFAQLYSCMIQRYIVKADKLSPDAKETFIYAIASVENIAVTELLGGRPVADIINALKKDDMSVLQKAHDALLGSDGRKGALQNKLNFNDIPKKLNAPTVSGPQE